MKLAVLNTTIATTDGSYKIKTISLIEAIELVKSSEIDSAVGHESTAAIASELLDVSIPVNRQYFEQKEGQQALVFKLKGRAPEGVILSREEIEKIGYEFKLMTREVEEKKCTEKKMKCMHCSWQAVQEHDYCKPCGLFLMQEQGK